MPVFSSLAFVSVVEHSTASHNLPIMLQVKLLSSNATMPTRWSPESAGFDLCAAEAKVVPAGGMEVIKTDLCVACPEGTYARIAPRRQVR